MFKKREKPKGNQRRNRKNLIKEEHKEVDSGVNHEEDAVVHNEKRMKKEAKNGVMQFKSTDSKQSKDGMVKDLLDKSYQTSGTAAQLSGHDSGVTIEVAPRRVEFSRGRKFMGKDMKERYGPRKGPDNIRTTTFFDYQPDVCKDYKETGYCGYGDSCKFLHDRSDYKSGWELEKEWEEKKFGMGQMGLDDEAVESEEEEDSDEIPFACFKCRRKFSIKMVPVVTSCGHYFCQKCAMDYHKKSKKCYICGQPTNGTFNVAHNVINKLKKAEKETETNSDSAKDYI